MGFFSDILKKGGSVLRSYAGDHKFLDAAAAAAALVIAADGTVEDSEVEAGIKGMLGNPVLSSSFSPSQIEDALAQALDKSKSRAGRIQIARVIEAAGVRELTQRQDIFLIATDVTEGNTISHLGPKETEALSRIADELRLPDWRKLIGG
jgi:tellurite resistance protein